MNRKLNLMLGLVIGAWGFSSAQETAPANKVTVTPSVKSTGKTNAWRNLASQVADNQKHAQDAETAESGSLLSPLFKGVTYDAGACVVDVCPPESKKGGFYAAFEYVSVTPYASSNTYLFGQSDSVNYDFDLDSVGTQRYIVGYRSTPCNLGFRARFWHYDEQFAAGGFFDNDAQAFVFNNVGIDDVDSGNNVVATSEMEIDVLDLEVTKSVGKNTVIAFGIRNAEFDQRFTAVNIAVDDSNLTSETDFQGIGPTIAIETAHGITPCLFVYGGLRGSLLFGDKSLVASDGTENAVTLNSEGLASSLDAELGVRYHLGCFNVNAGLEAQYWMDVGSPNPSGIDTGSSDTDPFGADIGFLGWKIGAGYDF